MFPNLSTPRIDRRTLLRNTAAIGAACVAGPVWARGGDLGHGAFRAGFDQVSGESLDFSITHGFQAVGDKSGHAFAVNGSIPGPLVRLKEGQKVALNVRNYLNKDTSIHWHGLLLPFHMDGVPGVSFPGIKPGGRFTAEFEVRQSGTYWYHSHSNLQEQAGHYGPIVIDPSGPDPVQADRDYVMLLSEFSPMHPHTIFQKLKKGEVYFNRQMMAKNDGYPMGAQERRAWDRMRMMPTDIADVSGATYTYLANGHGPDDGLEYLFKPGERVRLRIINGSGMSFFNVRVPGLPMTVVGTDGQNVKPVEVDELQIGVAETYDVVFEPGAKSAYTIVAESMDRSGMTVATLASKPGARAAVPALRDPPLLTMIDMGMNHGVGGHSGHGGGTEPAAGQGAAHGAGPAPSMSKADETPKDVTGALAMGDMPMRNTALLPSTVHAGPGLDMVSMAPADRMGDPGVGMSDVGHRVLNYRQLASLTPNKDKRTPSRMLELHLTGNMERYMWSFDGKKFTAVTDEPLRFAYNERVRVKLVNDTMMAHPIHLHGHFFELVNGHDGNQPLKHTVIVQPGGSAQFDFTADEPGDWAFHCHLLYHMHAGMFQVVTVAFPDGQGPESLVS